VRLWPHLYDTAGFFAALIRKQESVPAAHAAPPPARPLREQGFRPLKTAERTELLDGLRQQFGFDLEAVVEHQALALWKQRERIFALPELYLSLLANLPAVTAGMLIAERKGGKLIPSHELVSRFADRFTAGRLTISVQDGERWLMGHELQRRNMQAGVVLVQDERGRQLGRGKVVGKRIRNLLPRRLVY
jgi:16S rRNA (cytosine1407-C5)-methyltransferase